MKEHKTYKFKSEVKQLLHLMIHSLYSNKEIFLRELISNASDAVDKLRFLSLSQPDLYKNTIEPHVRISYNKNERTLTLSDNGIGMKHQEVIENLGTIAKSGTKDFLKLMQSNQEKVSQFIGQFGVGFYSAFVVANKVVVNTRRAGTNNDEGVYWESTGEGDYTIYNIYKEHHGTDVTLYLREKEDEFLDDLRLKNIVNKYSDHITLSVEIEKRTKSTKNNNKETIVWDKINQAQALWTRKKNDISEKEYKDFYKYLSHDVEDPLIWSHNKVEGIQEYISLLYIPTKAPWNIWNREYKHGLKLYVHRVFIMDDAEQFMPNYLRFVKGLIDSNDLPLNISREVLQNNYVTRNLKEALTKRILLILEKLHKENKESYQKFWQQFGLILKEGVAEDVNNNKKIAQLLRFTSTYNKNAIQDISLDEYLNRMIPKQEKIYYITADSYTAAKNSPHLEIFKQNNIEVLLLSDRIDAWMMNYLTQYNDILFQSISKLDNSLNKLIDKDTQEVKTFEKEWKLFIDRVNQHLGTRVKEVRLTHRLTDTPAVVITDANEMTTQMAKLFTAAGQATPDIKYIFELNPKHRIVKYIAHIVDDNLFNEWIELLFEQALLIEKGTLDDPNLFIHRVNKLFNIE